MGALRAAELHQFGMRGVGEIFEKYRNGTLEDDDEVAVLHGPAELGYPAASEALVNIRATLDEAMHGGLITSDIGAILLKHAKTAFFKNRSYHHLLQAYISDGGDTATAEALKKWLPLGRVDQKRLDAIRMLREIDQFVSSKPGPVRVPYHFETTLLWQRLTDAHRNKQTRNSAFDLGASTSGCAEGFHHLALYRELVSQECVRRGLKPGTAELRAATIRLANMLGLTTYEELNDWRNAHAIGQDQLIEIIELEVGILSLLRTQ
jgi:hypothetical protein